MRSYWKWALGAVGVAVILALCLYHIWLTGRPVTFFDYFVLDIAFLPLQVIVVSVIIERLLHERERRAMLKKMNMVIGAFFSEVGNELLRRTVQSCPPPSDWSAPFSADADWDDRSYLAAMARIDRMQCAPQPSPAQLGELKEFLLARRVFILALLQNPNLLEHEAFTDLLWAVTHLTEELAARASLLDLPPPDLAHLDGDLNRAFRLLIREWLSYLRHLRAEYPYIYSLALRANPLRPDRSAIVRQ